MATTNAVWGIDIGQCALKAVKLRVAEGGKVEAVAFDVVEHPKILSQPDAERDELIAKSLEKFASRNDWAGDKFIVGVPGQQTFARFCKMPPIDLKKDAKKIPELVRYEASQQIPFDMDDVVWDYQVFTSDDSPDIEVGIFAIRKDLIRKHLSFFSQVGIAPAGVQTIPASLYNFCHFDGQTPGENTATVIIDVGAQNTDLIIVEPNSAWTRNIPLGGNSFTEALVRSFKLSFAKAENLKRNAASSKYARQIFQAMRPVFSDLVSEIQRSIGFYSSTHRDIELQRVLALGNAFRLPGLLKYLENNLTISGGVVKLEKFNNLVSNETTAAKEFKDNVLSFPGAYGLALQGLGLAQIQATLLPPELARVAEWKRKRPYFIATAASLLIAAGVPLAANTLDRQALESPQAQEAARTTTSIINEARQYQREYDAAHQDTSQREKDIEDLLELQDKKFLVPRVVTLIYEAMPETVPPDLPYVSDPARLKEIADQVPRTERGQLLIEDFSVEYVPDVSQVSISSAARESVTGPAAGGMGGGGRMGGGRMGGGGRSSRSFAGGGMMRGPAPVATGKAAAPGENAGFVVRLQGRLLYGEKQSDAARWVEQTYKENLREASRRDGLGFYIPDDDPEKPSGRTIDVRPIARYHQDPSSGFAGGRPSTFGGGRTGGGRTGGGRTGGMTGGRMPSGFQGTETPAADAGSDVKHPDPVTGEETATDWRVELAFKLKIGTPPEPEPADESAANTENTNAARRGR